MIPANYSSTSFNASRSAGARSRGFSLLEVLIALLVLSIGLLGIAGLQVFSLKYNHQSYERTQATMLINEIVDRMRANPDAVTAGLYDDVPIGDPYSTYSGYGTCPTTCSSTDLFNYDIFQWKKRMQDAGMLASGKGGISVVDPATSLYAITISWTEDDVTPTQMAMVRIF
jgi:type IV pilus assembly protein PilV